MGRRAKLFEGQTGLIERAGRGGMDILSEDGKRLPKGKRLESKDNLYIGTPGHIGYQRQIAPEQRLFYHIGRRGKAGIDGHGVGLWGIRMVCHLVNNYCVDKITQQKRNGKETWHLFIGLK